MGTSTSLDQFAGKINRAAVAIEGQTEAGVREAAQATKAIFLAKLPTRVLRRVGKKGAKLGASYQVRGGQTPTAIVSFTGPVQLINNDTKAHKITPRGLQTYERGSRKGRAKNGAKALTIGGGLFVNADHPGTTGKKFFQAATREARVVAPKAMADGQVRAVRKAF